MGRRKFRSLEEKLALVREWQELTSQGLSQTVAATQLGINVSQLITWSKLAKPKVIVHEASPSTKTYKLKKRGSVSGTVMFVGNKEDLVSIARELGGVQ